jgi:hypothetical protein
MTQQFLEQNAMKRVPYPAHSPEIALSDFDLFGYVKELWQDKNFPMGRHFSEWSMRFWGISKKGPWREYFSSGWRGFVDISTPVESTSTKLSLRVNRIP